MVKKLLAAAVLVPYLAAALRPELAEAPTFGLTNSPLSIPQQCSIVAAPQDNPVPENMKDAVSKLHVPYVVNLASLKSPCLDTGIERLLKENAAKYDYSKMKRRFSDEIGLMEASMERQDKLASDPLYWEVVQVYNDMKSGKGFKHKFNFPSIITPELITAEITAESTGLLSAESYAGALGLMQVTPIAAEEVGLSFPFYKDRISKPYGSIQIGTTVLLKTNEKLAELFPEWGKRSKVDQLVLTLTAYNEGYPTTVDRAYEEMMHPHEKFFQSEQSFYYPWRVLGAFERIFPLTFKEYMKKFSPDHNPEAVLKLSPNPKIKNIRDYMPESEIEATRVNYEKSLRILVS